jgi:hypothetical protein
MKLTEQHLYQASSTRNGIAFNSYQFRILGLGFPQKKGWTKRLLGRDVPERQWQCVVELAGVRDSDKRKSIVSAYGVNAREMFTTPAGSVNVTNPSGVPEIAYPHKISEFEVQAQLYTALREQGLDVRGSVPARTVENAVMPRCYFDLVVFSAYKTPVVIIECKNRPERAAKRPLGGRQLRRYSTFNVPLILCDRLSEIKNTVNEVEKLVLEMEPTLTHHEE